MDDIERFTEEQVEALVKEAAPAEELKRVREQEQQLLHNFRRSPSKETFMPLYTSFKPWILKAAGKNMFGSPIPKAAHLAYAAQSFLDSTRTFDPSKGSFRTHAFNTVFEKGKRLNLKYQNIGYIPESRATKYQAYQTAHYLLSEQLGREPSTLELSDELALPPTEVERLRKEIRKDLVMREDIPHAGPAWAQSNKAMEVARDLQYSLIPKHRVVLEHALGLNGVQPLVKRNGGPDVSAISKTTKLSLTEVRSALKTISRKFKEQRGHLGQADQISLALDEASNELE